MGQSRASYGEEILSSANTPRPSVRNSSKRHTDETKGGGAVTLQTRARKKHLTPVNMVFACSQLCSFFAVKILIHNNMLSESSPQVCAVDDPLAL